MPFEFVNVTVGNPDHDDEARRRIRSQAMRDYRRRRRIGEDDPPSSPEPSESSLSSPRRSSASQSRQESRKRKGSTQSLPLNFEAPRRQSSGLSRDDLPPIEDLDMAKEDRQSPRSVHSDDPATKSRLKSRRDQPRTQNGVFGTFSVSLPMPPKPSRSINDDFDPLSSPGQLEEMLSICDSYNRWLISNLPSDAIDQPTGPWDNTTSQMLLFALCLKSIGHLEALHPPEITSNRHMFKTRVLALINKRLKNPAKALDDKTIGALACLTSYEISRGSTEAIMHLSGLSQIIKLRGGPAKIGSKGGLPMFLEILDIVHAIYFNSATLYTTADASQPNSTQDTPLFAPLGIPEFDQETLDEISDFFMSIPEMAEGEVLPSAPPLEPAITPSSFEQEVLEWHQFLSQAAQSIAPSYEGALAYACGLAAGLHLATTSPVAPHPVRVQLQAEELFAAMIHLPDDAWDAFHLVHLRILLTALSTASNLTQKSWYNAHLSRRLYHTDEDSWSVVKSLMLKFVEMQSMARQPRNQAVRALASGVEIVVDAAEADAMGLTVQMDTAEPWV